MVATIVDVAKKAGVSTSTVSKVLKNYANISTETKNKVHKAVKELNYIPNSTASNLSSKHRQKVALYIYINDMKQAVDEINMQYLQGAFKKANELGLEVVTIFNQSFIDYSKEELISYFISQGINAVVVYGLNKEDTVIHHLIDSSLFYVTVVDAPIVNNKTSSVMVDHVNGQYDIAKQIVSEDICHRVLYLAGKQNGYVTDLRIKGIQKLQVEMGFDLNIQYAEFSEKKAYQITKKLASSYDVVICASDLMAIGAVNALIDMNIYRRCCGYDGISLMGYAGKNMLTVKQDFFNVSMIAVEKIKELLDGNSGESILLPYEIVRIKYEDIIF